jgi:dienelactone hydrolase
MDNTRSVLVTIIFFSIHLSSWTQVVSNRVLGDEALQTWEYLSTQEPIASGDGQYFVYKVHQSNSSGKVILQSIRGEWKHNFGSVTPIGFSKDSRFFIYKTKDSLCFYGLKHHGLFRSITGVRKCELPAEKKKFSWLESNDHDYVWASWQLKTGNDLFLYNLITSKELRYSDVSKYLLDQNGTVLILQKLNYNIEWIDLATSKSFTVWSANLKNLQPGAMAIDTEGRQVVFVLQRINSHGADNSIWHYRRGKKEPEQMANNRSSGIGAGLMIGNSVSFNGDGRYININLQRLPSKQSPPNNIKVDVWNYRDTILQSTQLYGGDEQLDQTSFAAVIQIDNNSLTQLTHKFGDQVGASNGDYIVVKRNAIGDRFWLGLQDSNWVVFKQDGSRRFLGVGNEMQCHFSPDGKYLLYYHPLLHNYYSVELATGKTNNLTASLPAQTMAVVQLDYSYPFEQPGKKLIGNWTSGVAGWMEGGSKVLVYDDYDIWLLDISALEKPINLTLGYGFKNKIQFRLAALEKLTNLAWKSPLLLVAFNRNTKENGFYQVVPGKLMQPKLLTMGPYTYYHAYGAAHINGPNSPDAGMPPVAIKNNKTWIVKRQSGRQAVNYYLTEDFKTFKSLTAYAPENKYNWLQPELLTWRRLDGDINQGLMYKPENFDPNKKYPVIINVYSRQSDGLYRYLLPRYSMSPLFNIPYMVSRGYLVFMPDAHYMIGAHGRSGLVSVESGVQALSQLPYVDTTKMALTGHSFSGLTAYYAAIHSKMFKAVIAGAGRTDNISDYLQLAGPTGKAKTDSRMAILESRFNDYTIWDRLDLYEAESPVLHANKAQTPLLIFHNQSDHIAFEQAVEMFLALRRLEKPCWMLQYDGAGHIVGGDQAVDFTKRITQYFDHYLKDEPAPRWMTRGIRAANKGIDDGLSLDPDGKCSEICNVCNKITSTAKNKKE